MVILNIINNVLVV